MAAKKPTTITPTPITNPVCKRILSAALKKQRFADLYGCVDVSVIAEYGYKGVSEAILAVAMSLATRCQRRKPLMKEILQAAPCCS